VDVYVPGCPPRPEALPVRLMKAQERVIQEDRVLRRKGDTLGSLARASIALDGVHEVTGIMDAAGHHQRLSCCSLAERYRLPGRGRSQWERSCGRTGGDRGWSRAFASRRGRGFDKRLRCASPRWTNRRRRRRASSSSITSGPTRTTHGFVLKVHHAARVAVGAHRRERVGVRTGTSESAYDLFRHQPSPGHSDTVAASCGRDDWIGYPLRKDWVDHGRSTTAARP